MYSLSFKLARYIYTLCIYILSPFILCRLWLKGINQPTYRHRWKERLGFIQATKQPCILIHCVSVGETHAAEPLITALLSELPSYHLHITAMTPTGSKAIQTRWHDQVSHSYLPYDTPTALHRFLKRLMPSLVIILETEVWPNLLYICNQKNIPVLLSNARLSERSARRYQIVSAFSKDLFSLPTHIAAQSTTDAQHYRQIGVENDKITVTNSLKFDKPIPISLIDTAQTCRQRWQLNEIPLIMAGSTRQGEENIVLDAFSQLKKQHADTCLLLAPRHPQRFLTVKNLCEQKGFRVIDSQILSKTTTPSFKPDIILINEMGRLPHYYAMADICFVGGSLVNCGCQNVLEPAALGKPIITGPSTYNFKQICQWLTDKNALIKVQDANELSQAWLSLVLDQNKREAMGQAALSVVTLHKGATQVNLKIIKTLLRVQ